MAVASWNRLRFQLGRSWPDLLFIEELKKRQGSALVFLPFPRATFKQTSVGYGWDKQFDAALDGVEVVELANEMPPKNKQPDAYVDCNRQILDAALQKAKLFDQEPLLITVWNGNADEGAGGTAHAVRGWREDGHAVDLIDISKL